MKARRELCCRCGQRIDYSLDYPDPGAFTVDHFPHAWSTHPHLASDPANCHAAHAHCNQSAGNAGTIVSAANLGTPSEAW